MIEGEVQRFLVGCALASLNFCTRVRWSSGRKYRQDGQAHALPAMPRQPRVPRQFRPLEGDHKPQQCHSPTLAGGRTSSSWASRLVAVNSSARLGPRSCSWPPGRCHQREGRGPKHGSGRRTGRRALRRRRSRGPIARRDARARAAEFLCYARNLRRALASSRILRA